MKCYKFDLTSKNGVKLDYPVPTSEFYETRYEWIPENAGKGGGAKHATVYCKSEEDLSVYPEVQEITEKEFDDVGKIEIQSVKNRDGTVDIEIITPKPKGSVNLLVIMPDGTQRTIEKPVNAARKALARIAANSGQVKVKAQSDVFNGPNLRHVQKVIDLD